MVRFVARRVLASIPVVLLASVAVFVMVATSTDPLGALRDRPGVPAAVIQQRTEELHLDRPVLVRYGLWAAGAARGDLGVTLDDRPVRPLVLARLAVTLRMVALGILLALLGAVAVGTVGALRRHRAADHALTASALVLVSLPVFWLAGVLKEYVAIRVNDLVGRQVLFTVGSETPGLRGGFWSRLGDQVGHLALPTLTLSLAALAVWSRYQRVSMIEALEADHVHLARAKGLSRRRVVFRHGVRNSLGPLTTVAATDVAAVLGGAVVIERVFSWQGMGALLLDGVRSGDVNVVAAWLLVASVLVIGCNLVADLVHAGLDPRVRGG